MLVVHLDPGQPPTLSTQKWTMWLTNSISNLSVQKFKDFLKKIFK